MGCWVVPSIAAELWGVPVGSVAEAIGAGRLRSKVESGFLLVDVDSRGPQPSPARLPKDQRPPTFTPIVTPAEMTALLDGLPKRAAGNQPAPAAPDWQAVRQRVSRTRRSAAA